MLTGKLLKGKRLNYEAGMFRFDGENSDVQGIPTAGRTYAARVSWIPAAARVRLPQAHRLHLRRLRSCTTSPQMSTVKVNAWPSSSLAVAIVPPT